MLQEILTGPERRRRWSDEQKIAIVMEASHCDHSVASVARRHDITRQHIYQWRSAMRRGALGRADGPGFHEVQLDIAAGGVPPGGMLPGGTDPAEFDHRIEIMVCNGRVPRIPTGLPDAVLSRLIRVVEAA